MVKKYHNHKQQTNPWQRVEDPHDKFFLMNVFIVYCSVYTFKFICTACVIACKHQPQCRHQHISYHSRET